MHMDREHQQNKPDKGHSEKIEFNERTQAWRNSTQERAYSEEYTNTVQLVNKQHLHSTTTIRIHLTTADYQRICQDPASEFFLNKRTWIYARGLQQERFSVLWTTHIQDPPTLCFQKARRSGATLSECTFSLKKRTSLRRLLQDNNFQTT